MEVNSVYDIDLIGLLALILMGILLKIQTSKYWNVQAFSLAQIYFYKSGAYR